MIENEWLRLWKEYTKLSAEFVRKEKMLLMDYEGSIIGTD